MASSTIKVYHGDNTSIPIQVRLLNNRNIAQILPATSLGTAVNLTGSALRMTAKWKPDDLDAAAVFAGATGGFGITITDAANGLATIALVPANTNSLPYHEVRLYYDIQLLDSGSNVSTLLTGTLIVLPDISITAP
jgi:hypothetical protein